MTRLFAGTEWDQPPRCNQCGKVECDCLSIAKKKLTKPHVTPQQQTVRLAVEKRKRGKQMTVVRGLTAADNDLPALLTKLKTICGAGGTVKGDLIEVQGKHLDRLRQALAEIGYRVKA